MLLFKKVTGKHHYRKDGVLHTLKAGETIECERSFLGTGAILTFKELKKKNTSTEEIKQTKKKFKREERQ